MELETFRGIRRGAELAHRWCRKTFAATDATSLFLPAGSSVIELYKLWEEKRPSYLEGVSFLQVDDVADGPRRGMFLVFLFQHLPSYRDRIVPVSRGERPAELTILGFGANGHVAFHEPGLRDDLDKALVPLADETVDRLALAPGTLGLTYGVGAFLHTEAILLIVSGEGKVDAFQRFLADDPALPAARLRAHADLTVLVDDRISAAASA